MKDKSKVGVIVVLYNTIPKKFPTFIGDTDSVLILVDNTPDQDLGITNTDSFIYIPLGQNKGIAEAQNIGIDTAKNARCTHVIFFDQDTIIDSRYIDNIIEEYNRICIDHPNLFLLGPTIINGRKGWKYKSAKDSNISHDNSFTICREIISSGSCTSMNKIARVGKLESLLFIDYVDFEWCWRSRHLGFINGMTSNVSLNHFVGQREIRLFNKIIIISSPFRYYYQTRNFISLTRRRYVPTKWKITSGIKKILYPIYFPFKVKEWRKIYAEIFRGFIAGIKDLFAS